MYFACVWTTTAILHVHFSIDQAPLFTILLTFERVEILLNPLFSSSCYVCTLGPPSYVAGPFFLERYFTTAKVCKLPTLYSVARSCVLVNP